jgi:hypothetical protein
LPEALKRVGYGSVVALGRSRDKDQGTPSASHRVTTSARPDLSKPWTQEVERVDVPKYKPRTKAEAMVVYFFLLLPWISLGVVLWLVLSR